MPLFHATVLETCFCDLFKHKTRKYSIKYKLIFDFKTFRRRKLDIIIVFKDPPELIHTLSINLPL